MKKVTNWEVLGFVISSSYRKRVLEKLGIPKMPSALSKELSINKTHISRTLKELQDKKLVKCLNPTINKGKIYLITGEGKNILEEIEKVK